MSKTVLMLTPGYPGEMPHFTRGLSEHGATVLGVANGPAHDLPEMARHHLSDYLQIADLFSHPQSAIAQIRKWLGNRTLDRVCCLWEPGVEVAAEIREALGVPGQSYEQALRFRNKDLMKQALAAGGVRVPHHAVATNAAEVWAAAEQVGYPLIIKPIAGAGSQDTFRCDTRSRSKRPSRSWGTSTPSTSKNSSTERSSRTTPSVPAATSSISTWATIVRGR